MCPGPVPQKETKLNPKAKAFVPRSRQQASTSSSTAPSPATIQPTPMPTQNQVVRSNCGPSPSMSIPVPVSTSPSAASGPTITVAMGMRTGDPGYARIWTVENMVLVLAGIYGSGINIRIVGSVHQNFGDVSGPHFTYEINGIRYHYYVNSGMIS
ncbi:PABP-interacting PAM2 motif-containing protein [Teredinibacter sp. KSP-S5-2]|uniref:PABP-interacting PAM2 motif-containing protein n=1 Tax=Teredinibacter sp. KSP-S5-2 TaxID=3034506 RepID=UPI0029345F1A|nr:PABP-interacting PAM2 motif-containing protein [Teredinibacter sp. KSP-S5-2]WNO08314.1 PABP-interacting PAM2 motif-containing protein [Teredinibacter sp. KSP-S5-2]